MNNRRTSQAGIDFIKQFEGKKLTAYKDIAGLWTIGYGHLIKPNESYLIGATITEAEAEKLLRDDLKQFENAVNQTITEIKLTQNQFDALVSLAFNIGVSAFRNSSLVRNINAKLPASDIRGRWIVWNKARVNGVLQEVKGLTRRREAEIEMYFGSKKK
jgi:lysozyme